MSTVRRNILNQKGYTPYCGDMKCRSMPRTIFKNDQFECPRCGWRSQFEQEFIELYKQKK